MSNNSIVQKLWDLCDVLSCGMTELVPDTHRLSLMNCLLHGMEGDDEGVVHLGNALGQVASNLPKVDIIWV